MCILSGLAFSFPPSVLGFLGRVVVVFVLNYSLVGWLFFFIINHVFFRKLQIINTS